MFAQSWQTAAYSPPCRRKSLEQHAQTFVGQRSTLQLPLNQLIALTGTKQFGRSIRLGFHASPQHATITILRRFGYAFVDSATDNSADLWIIESVPAR